MRSVSMTRLVPLLAAAALAAAFLPSAGAQAGAAPAGGHRIRSRITGGAGPWREYHFGPQLARHSFPAVQAAADQGPGCGAEEDASQLPEVRAHHPGPAGHLRLRHRAAVAQGYRRGRDHDRGHGGLEGSEHRQGRRRLRQDVRAAEPADHHDLPGGPAAEEVPAGHGGAWQFRVVQGVGGRAGAGRAFRAPDRAVREDHHLRDAGRHAGDRRRGQSGRDAGDHERRRGHRG